MKSKLAIMVDADEEGYLLQIFHKTSARQTDFIFRNYSKNGSQGFGAGNFKALFESIERAL
jgi:4-hydroxyphenylpyruvate dioxygenase